MYVAKQTNKQTTGLTYCRVKTVSESALCFFLLIDSYRYKVKYKVNPSYELEGAFIIIALYTLIAIIILQLPTVATDLT